jgi:hypothetical protein
MTKLQAVKGTARRTDLSARTADYAIQGFLYQFNKTLLAIMESSDAAEIVVEGIIEDIDVHEPILTTAIQCKYHEGKSKFTLSVIYKPILQMINHFRNHSSESIEYRIYCYSPDKTSADSLDISTTDLDEIFGSTNKDLSGLISQVKGQVNIAAFVARVRVEFGLQLDELVAAVHLKLGECGFQADDIPTLIYPNAIHAIANMSINHDATRRRVRKPDFIRGLGDIRKTMISRWTLLLRTRASLMKAKRAELKTNISKNVRRRTFILSKESLSDFDTEIVMFISEFIDKCHSKPAHTKTPVFCLDCDEATFSAIRLRVYEKGIRFNDGLVGNQFVRAHFVRPPIVTKSRDRADREFSIRLLRYETDPEALNTPKYDDLFVISVKTYNQPLLTDVNKEQLATENMLQTKYLLGVSDVYE